MKEDDCQKYVVVVVDVLNGLNDGDDDELVVEAADNVEGLIDIVVEEDLVEADVDGIVAVVSLHVGGGVDIFDHEDVVLYEGEVEQDVFLDVVLKISEVVDAQWEVVVSKKPKMMKR